MAQQKKFQVHYAPCDISRLEVLSGSFNIDPHPPIRALQHGNKHCLCANLSQHDYPFNGSLHSREFGQQVGGL